MPRPKHSELAAGIFVVLALGAGVGVLIWLGTTQIFKPPVGQAVFFAPEASGATGLEVGNYVQFGDSIVGQIGEILAVPEKNRTLYFARIDRPGMKIFSDGQAHVPFLLVGSAKLVITSIGTEQAGLASAEHPLKIAGGLDEAVSNAFDAIDKIKSMSDILLAEMEAGKPDTLMAKIQAITKDLQDATASIRLQLDPNKPDTLLGRLNAIAGNIRDETDPQQKDSTMAMVRRSVSDINDMTADAKPKVQEALAAADNTAKALEGYTKKDLAEILANVRKASSGLVEIVANVNTASGTARDAVVMNRQNLDDMIANLKSTAANLNSAAKEIRRNPWRLLQQPSDKDVRTRNIYDAVRAFGEGAEQLDNALARLNALREARPGGVGADDPELVKIRQYLEETFKKFRTAEDALWKEVAR